MSKQENINNLYNLLNTNNKKLAITTIAKHLLIDENTVKHTYIYNKNTPEKKQFFVVSTLQKIVQIQINETRKFL